MGAAVKLVGFDRIVKKLDAQALTGPARHKLAEDTAHVARDFLEPRIPRLTGASARTLSLTITETLVKLSVAAFPLRYQEFGTRYIKKRKFMSATISKARRELRLRIPEAVASLEKEWVS
jgi:hypothetical protein